MSIEEDDRQNIDDPGEGQTGESQTGEDPAGADRTGETARHWVVRLASGAMTADDLALLKAWRGEAPAHEEAFAEARALWQGLAPLQATFERLEQADPVVRPAGIAQAAGVAGVAGAAPLRHRRRTGAFAGALALAACLLLLAFAPQLVTDVAIGLKADYSSGDTAVRTVTLADGSRITLDRNSAIALHFTAALREVELLRGEAFFEVKPNPARPFSVLAAGGRSEAVGTAYAVRLGETGVRVAVTQGHVAVSAADPAGGAAGNPAETRALTAGEGLRYGDGGRLGAAFPLDGARTLAWRNSKVVFANRPLAEALHDLERYHPGRIVLWGGGRRGQPVSGVVDLDRLDEGLAALAATYGLSAVTVTPFLTVLR